MIRMKDVFTTVIFIVALILAIASLHGCNQGKNAPATGEIRPAAAEGSGMSFGTEYQAVFMDNGQAFFGKLQNAGSAYPVLTDVFYIARQQDPQTKEVKNILVRRGSEWHGPDRMYINASHIAVIEPVSSGSQVSRLINEAKTQKAPAAQ